jgi:hypothetical protein
MFSDSRYLRRCLIGLASLVPISYAMLSDTAGQGTQEQVLRRLLHQRTLELSRAKGFSPGNALELMIEIGDQKGAETYYNRIAPLIGFSPLLDANSNLNDLLNYLGYKGLAAKDLEELTPNELMPPTAAEFQVLASKVQDPALFAANRRLADFQQDRVLVSRFFAPKIVNYNEVNRAPGSKNPFTAGWRKLVRLRPTSSSEADKGGIAEAYILFNFFEPLETKDPFLNESGNNQVILVPKAFNTTSGPKAKDSAFWMLYQKKSLGYRLGFALNVGFDLPDCPPPACPTTRDYFVPVACAQCHGHDQERGLPLGGDLSKGVFPYAKVNYLDTDQWNDMVEYDFPGTKLGPHDVVFDSKKAAPGSAEYERAFGILRKLNEVALKQNRASKRPDKANDFRIKGAEKWIEVHKTTSAPVQPLLRAIDMGTGVVWSKAVPNDKGLLESLNRFCFRCHSSLYWSVFDKSFVSAQKDLIRDFISSEYMPQGRVIPEPEKTALLSLLGNPPDTNFYHKLSPKDANLFRAMDVIAGGPQNNITQLAETGDFSGQFWRFIPTGDGSFRLTTLFRGRDMCADIFNEGENDNRPHLTPCADFSGQFWFVTVMSDAAPTNTFFARLTTKFRGPNMCLDHFQEGDAFFPRLAPCANVPRQLWLVSRTDRRVK